MTRAFTLLPFPPQERAKPEAAPAPKPWPRLAAPVDAMETVLRSRAQSALCGVEFRDGSRVGELPSIEQARDILAWYRPR